MKRKLVSLLLGITLSIAVVGCGTNTNTIEETQTTESTEVQMEGASHIVLSDEEITLDGNSVTTDTSSAVYVANDIVYYEEGHDFTYGEGTEEEAHSAEEAAAHTVVHINKPGTYVVSGSLSKGQIAVDLGEEAEEDPEAVVTLVLDNADITCEVAPAVIFYNVYECSSNDEDSAVRDVDTSKAGANVILADGSVNNISGSHVARIYESVTLSEDRTEVVDSKKLHKYDGAFYSKMSMNINGEEEGTGILNILADNEGLNSELHLTINGGNINIMSGNDGINTNEDNVSVTTINGGNLDIVVEGSTGEGDGIDSNGWLVINGGTVTAAACDKSSDAGIDADKGIHINGGVVEASGNMLDAISESSQNYMVLSFGEQAAPEDVITLKNADGEVVGEWSPENGYTYLIVSMPELTEGTYTVWKNETRLSGVAMSGSMGGPGMIPGGGLQGERPEMPEGEMPGGERPQMPEGEMLEMPEGEMLESDERPQMPEGEMTEGGKGGRNPMQQTSAENASTEFVIQNGGNAFIVVE